MGILGGLGGLGILGVGLGGGRKKPGCSRIPAFTLGIVCSPRVDWLGGTGEISFSSGAGLFSHNLEGDFNGNLFVEVDFGGVFAKFLDGYTRIALCSLL